MSKYKIRMVSKIEYNSFLEIEANSAVEAIKEAEKKCNVGKIKWAIKSIKIKE